MTSDVSQKLGVLERPMLVADRLACRRNRELLFSGLSFSIYPGQVVWLRGQNGRGKTSLMRLLVGLSAPDEGTLTWRGSDGGSTANVASNS